MKFKLIEKFDRNIPDSLRGYFRKFPEQQHEFAMYLYRNHIDSSTAKIKEISVKEVSERRFQEKEPYSFWIDMITGDNSYDNLLRSVSAAQEDRYYYLIISYTKRPDRYLSSKERLGSFYSGNINKRDAMELYPKYKYYYEYDSLPNSYVDKSGYYSPSQFSSSRFSSDAMKYYKNKTPQDVINSIQDRIERIDGLMRQFVNEMDFSSSKDAAIFNDYLKQFPKIKEKAEQYINKLSEMSPSETKDMKQFQKLLKIGGSLNTFYQNLYDLYLKVEQQAPTDFNW